MVDNTMKFIKVLLKLLYDLESSMVLHSRKYYLLPCILFSFTFGVTLHTTPTTYELQANIVLIGNASWINERIRLTTQFMKRYTEKLQLRKSYRDS